MMMATGDDDDEVDDDCDVADGATRTDVDVGPRRQCIVVGGASAAPSDARAAALEPCI